MGENVTARESSMRSHWVLLFFEIITCGFFFVLRMCWPYFDKAWASVWEVTLLLMKLIVMEFRLSIQWRVMAKSTRGMWKKLMRTGVIVRMSGCSVSIGTLTSGARYA